MTASPPLPHSVTTFFLFFFFYFCRIQALANLNEDDLPDVAIQMPQTAGSANTTWVIAKHMCLVFSLPPLADYYDQVAPFLSYFIHFTITTIKNMADSGT